MQLNIRQQQLRERDVRKLAPDLNPNAFMQMYLESNFPETSAYPSQQQLERGVDVNNQADTLKLMKKPLSGTKFDNPGGF